MQKRKMKAPNMFMNNVKVINVNLAFCVHTLKRVSPHCPGIDFSISNGINNCIMGSTKAHGSEVLKRVDSGLF